MKKEKAAKLFLNEAFGIIKKTKKVFLTTFILFIIVTVAWTADKKIKSEIKTIENYIAVFDFEVTTGDQGISRPLSDKVIHELSTSDKYEVIDRGNMNKILKEQKFQMSGCVAQECKVEAGQILGVGKIVSGSVGIVGKTYYLTLLLIDVKTGKVELSAEDECRCEIDELLGSTKRLARKLLGEQVAQPTGKAEQTAKAKADAEVKARIESEARARAEAEAKVKAEFEARDRAEEVERIRAEQIAIAKAKADAEAKARAEAELKARQEADARAKAEAEARAKAEQLAASKARAEAEAKARAEAEARAKVEAEARARAEAEAKARAEEIERLKSVQTAKAKAEAEAKAREEAETRLKAEQLAAAKARADAEAKAKIEAEKTAKDGTKAETVAKVAAAKTAASDGRFEKLESGVVRDTKSGLEWYAGPDEGTSQVEAKAWAEKLKIDGGRWRMPTISELKSLYLKGAGSRNMTPLLETVGWLVWSGETGVSSGGGDFKAWAVDFSDGRESLDRRANSNYMRGFAVRSMSKPVTSEIDKQVSANKAIATDGRFEKLRNGVVWDTKSGLEWYAGPDKNTNHSEATQWAADLKVDGGGWRMPAISELKGLFQKGAGPRNITSLIETTGWLIWSVEAGVGPGGMVEGNRLVLDLDTGRELTERRDNPNYKRGFAVRSRTKGSSPVDSAIAGTRAFTSDGRFEKFASGIVHDTKSGLEWYAGPDKNIGWDDAKQWVFKLEVDDGGGWRMPTIAELRSLFRKGAGPRNMTPLLQTTGWWVWSVETAGLGMVAGNSGLAFDFDNGTESLDRRDNSNYKRVFAVRSRK